MICKIIIKIEKFTNDKELYHSYLDVIYRKFIREIATGKINNEEIVNLAKLLNNKVVKK